MATASERTALAALDAARPVIARLDTARGSEDLAADLIESWSAVETALRSLLGGSSLTGHALIRELRQRQALTFEQANALAEFSAARDRAQRTDYRPSPADVSAARDAFLKLETGLMASVNPPPPVPTPRSAATIPMPSGETMERAPRPRRRVPWIPVAAGAVFAVLIALLLIFQPFGNSSTKDTREGIRLLSEGKREVARDMFKKAAREDPKAALPLVYVGRMFREEQRFDSARVYLETAIRRDPGNAAAFREMAKLLFTQRNYELARTFFIRSIQAEPGNREAQGYLGCTLIRLGRFEEGQRFIQRAGSGDWSACAAQVPQMNPQLVPPA